VTLREKYRLYRKTVWTGTPVGSFVLGVSAVPPRPFVIVTAANPRSRERDRLAGKAKGPGTAAHEDEIANETLAKAIHDAGFEPLRCVGTDPDSPHKEPSWWVWDATPAKALQWGRAGDQIAVVIGDGVNARLISCFPEWEPQSAPDVVLLLHELDGSGDGTPALLERELRARGWTETVFLRPTLQLGATLGVNAADLFARAREAMAAELARAGTTPMLVIGLRESGLLAAVHEAPWRIGVGSPWSLLPPGTLAREASSPGLFAIFGETDTEMLKELAALPREVPRLVDPEGGRDLSAWVGRIADGVFRLWTAPLAPRAAIAAGWRITGYRGALMRGAAADAAAGHSVAAGVAIAAGILLSLLGALVALAGLAFFAVLLICSGSSRSMQGDVLFMLGALFVGLGGGAGLIYAGVKLSRSTRTASASTPRRGGSTGLVRAGIAAIAAGAGLFIGAEVLVALAQMNSSNFSVTPAFHVGLGGLSLLFAGAGTVLLIVSAARR